LSIRYLSSLALALVAGFEVVAFQAFSPAVYTWLAFGGGIAIVTIALAAGAVDRGKGQRALNALAAVAGAWIIVSSLVFASSTVVWLGFSAAASVVVLAVVGLTLHELRDERALHAVETRTNQTSPSGRTAEFAS
jgi:cation transport ATPase